MRTSRCIFYTAVGTVLSLLYVFQQTEIVKLGYKITASEKVLGTALDRQTSLEYALSSLESPLSLDKNLFFKNDGFEMAKEYKLVRLEPASSDVKSAGPASNQIKTMFKRLASQLLLANRQAEARTVK